MPHPTSIPPFEAQRIAWSEAGHTVLTNVKEDTYLIAHARRRGRLQWIDRKTKWGNPFVTRQHTPAAHERVVQQYAHWFMNQVALQQALPELFGMVLLCHCVPLPCHGEVLLAWIDPQWAASSPTSAELLAQDAPGRVVRPAAAHAPGPQLTLWER